MMPRLALRIVSVSPNSRVYQRMLRSMGTSLYLRW